MSASRKNKPHILQPALFERNTLCVAKELLGKVLVCKTRGKEQRAMITEVEAYDGPNDKASHASKGLTPRTAVMFGPAGVWYVYLVYGMHYMLNIVTGEVGYPAAVLIRGVKTSQGIDIIGPARVTKYLGITKAFNTTPATTKTGLWIEDAGKTVYKKNIKATPRIGVHYAGFVWANKPYRFLLTYSANDALRL
ncbi:MAG TPA: DNA-3-methyladenine glycosylase [Patescibacteria group bacterium]|nr:DNA-3-methyladenine glycosylase [Patescibacteria group bacterium]